ncbi:MAG: export transporter periplasmic protein LptC [Pseudomonadota bacterium]|jgi:lipopolysaccharide export system protein LptC
MARRATLDGWSRLVSWLKVALPLSALAILSTLFLVSKRINPEDAIPYAEVDVEARLREPRMTAPTYAGTTRDGAALSIRAAEARPAPKGSQAASATTVTARLTTPDGRSTELVADQAQMSGAGDAITFTGAVAVAHSTGYTVQTEGLAAALGRTDFRSLAPVTADGPAGHITADAMQLTADPGTPGAYLLVFNGKVKLIYQPVATTSAQPQTNP